MKIKVYVLDVKLPRWVRRALVFGGVPAVILGLGALVYAALPVPVPTFTDGTVLSAAPLTALGTDITNLDTRLAAVEASMSGMVATPGAWTAWTPTITAGSGTFATVSATGRYLQIGKLVHFSMAISITANGTAAGTVVATLPTSTANLMVGSIVCGRENSVTGNMLQGLMAANSNVVYIYNYANGYPGGSGYMLFVSGVYEAA